LLPKIPKNWKLEIGNGKWEMGNGKWEMGDSTVTHCSLTGAVSSTLAHQDLIPILGAALFWTWVRTRSRACRGRRSLWQRAGKNCTTAESSQAVRLPLMPNHPRLVDNSGAEKEIVDATNSVASCEIFHWFGSIKYIQL
jgi:hypothetical protein